MTQARGLFMEFLVVAALVALAGAAVVLLTATGHEHASATGALLDILKVGFGAITALAYAARDFVKPPRDGGDA